MLRSGPDVLKGSGVLGQGRDMGSPRTHTKLKKKPKQKSKQCTQSDVNVKNK